MNKNQDSQELNNAKANFGFQEVDKNLKQSLVNKVFNEVAGKYDVMNDIMSLGLHHIWKKRFVNLIPNLDSNILDVAGGTGDIAFNIKKRALNCGKNPKITIADINYEMLKKCKDKAFDKNYFNNLDIVTCDAQKLPFQDNSFDYYTIAFGIRNVSDIDIALKEAHRVLKKGGKFLCLEFSKIDNSFVQSLYDFYSFNIIPKIGKFVAGNEPAYRYLSESIDLFPNQDEFKVKILNAGFNNVSYINLSGGIASMHTAYKI